MTEENKISFPLGTLILEFIGSVLMALGFAKQFADIELIPVISQYDVSGWLLIGVGFLLTLPFVFFILAKVRERVEQKLVK